MLKGAKLLIFSFYEETCCTWIISLSLFFLVKLACSKMHTQILQRIRTTQIRGCTKNIYLKTTGCVTITTGQESR